jgi:Fic family protein
MAIPYERPSNWILYDSSAIIGELVGAKSAVESLSETPYQRDWVERLQQIQLKMEVAGTSKIEGADFTEGELEVALDPTSSPEGLATRSQQQAFAAAAAYRWIATLPIDQPIDAELIKQIHRLIVKDCDDDHCPPGQLRGGDSNVTFGNPRHRGCEGGVECKLALDNLVDAAERSFKGHDPLIQALAFHYHIAAMHPFLDGNGRTARAVEALALRRAGLKATTFIAMSNYYYDEKANYLKALSAVRAAGHDLTAFLVFALRGITIQCQRLLLEIRKNMAKALFRNMMYDLFNRLATKRQRVIKDRQIELLKSLLSVESIDWHDFVSKSTLLYHQLKTPTQALERDVLNLLNLGAVRIDKVSEGKWKIAVRLEWPSEITESAFFQKIKEKPKGKTYKFLP